MTGVDTPIDFDRSRKVPLLKIARKPAPMLVPDRLTVKVTVKICGAASSPLRIRGLEGSLMTEWE
jgi:hypothetical protein